jgi:signal transduction histidine kinase
MEEVSGNWPSVLGVSESIGCFPDQQDLPYLKARFTAISDILTETISPCHRNFLQSIQVRANLVVPIQIGDQLWGLLIAHQCGSPRNWQDAEINLLQQLADKAAIAIQQAQLYEQSCAAEAEAINKAQQLEHTLNQLQQTQAQLIHTEKMSGLGQLVAGIAHEINNPVSFIYGNLTHASEYIEQLLELLQLYQLYYPNPDPVIRSTLEAIDIDFLMQDLPKVITSMSVGANRIRSIVLSLRNFSRLDESEDKSVDLHEGINNTLLILQHRLKPNGHFSGIEVIKDYGILPNIICYAGHINQVFMNIINNAIDILREDIENTDSIHKNEHFSQKTPTIKITTRVSIDNSHIIIKIADNGSGMPEQVKKRIFDPFFTTKPVGKGTGLGLAISYQIVVEKHKGMMGCISEPGNGTEFWIEIPLKKE